MRPEDVHHLRAVGRAAASGTDYFGRLGKLCTGHDADELQVLEHARGG